MAITLVYYIMPLLCIIWLIQLHGKGFYEGYELHPHQSDISIHFIGKYSNSYLLVSNGFWQLVLPVEWITIQ